MISLLSLLFFSIVSSKSWDLKSSEGLVEVTILDKIKFVNYSGYMTLLRCWNGSVVGPNFHVNPGDRLKLTLINNLPEPTNIHFHGFLVSPTMDHGDSVFTVIKPNETYTFDILIPKDHPLGIGWYHSHLHGTSEQQLQSGMSGMIIVGDIFQRWPEFRDIKKIPMQLKDIQLEKKDKYYVPKSVVKPEEDTLRTLNGLTYPTFEIEENETQFWMIGAFGPNIYYNLSFGGYPMYELVRDLGILNRLVPCNYYLLGPGARVGLLLQLPRGAKANFNFATLHFNNGDGVHGDQYPEVQLAQVQVKKGGKLVPKKLPSDNFPKLYDYRNAKINKERFIVFSEEFTENKFFIDGKYYDEDRIDYYVKFGDIEKWVIYNSAPANHYFHIHQVKFQVVEYNKTKIHFEGYQDGVQIPYEGNTTIIVPFNDPVIIGKFVMHCHIVGHEDHGMMANILVEP